MDKTLLALYDGELFPAEQYLPTLEKYKVLKENQKQHYKEFIEKLGSPLDEEFMRIMDEQRDTVPLEFSQMFIDGFRLGAKIVIEVFDDNKRHDN